MLGPDTRWTPRHRPTRGRCDAATDPWVARELVVVDRSPGFPGNTRAVRRDLDPDVTRRRKAILLHMDEDPRGETVLKAFGVRRFIPTGDADFVPVMAHARAISLDLTTYDDFNKKPATEEARLSAASDRQSLPTAAR